MVPSALSLHNCFLVVHGACGIIGSARRLFEEVQRVVCLDVVSYNTHLNAGRLHGAVELAVEMSSRGVCSSRVAFNELLRARVLAKGSDGTHSHCVIKRVFDLVMETEVDDAMLSFAVVACIRFYTHGTSAAIAELAALHAVKRLRAHFQVMFNSIGQMGDVGRGP